MTPRALAGLALAVVAVLLAAPPTVVPWGAPVHTAFASWATGFAPGSALRHAALLLEPFSLSIVVGGLLVGAGFLLPRAELASRRPGMLALGLGVLLLIEPLVHLGLLALIAWHAPPGSGDLMLPRVPGASRISPAVQFAVLSLAMPVAEEFFFRGRLVPFLRDTLGAPSALSLSALAFACAHGDPCQALVALPLGVLLGWLRLSGGGLGGCIVVHQAHNTLLLISGSTVVAAPWVGLILGLAAVACLALGWAWPRRGSGASLGRVGIASLAAVAMILALYPLYQSAQDRVWLSAMLRTLATGRLQDDILLARLDHQCTRGIIDGARRKALARALVAHRVDSPDRQVWLVARLDPDALRTDDVELAHDRLTRLSSCPLRLDSHGIAARTLARAHPGALSMLLTEFMDGDLVQRWYPLPEAADEALEQITVCSGAERHRFLAGLERAYPGRIADLLFRLRPDEVTQADRHFLFDRYADAEARLAALASIDPERAQAFRAP